MTIREAALCVGRTVGTLTDHGETPMHLHTPTSKKDLALMLLAYYDERAAAQYPREAANGRLSRATGLILVGKCRYIDAQTWQVTDSPGQAYEVRVDNDRNTSCNCPDSDVVAGPCTHRLAVAIQDALEWAVGSAHSAHYAPWGEEDGQGFVWPNTCGAYTFYSPSRGKGMEIPDIGKVDIAIGGLV